jgi:hypothetical protein
LDAKNGTGGDIALGQRLKGLRRDPLVTTETAGYSGFSISLSLKETGEWQERT